MEYIRRLIAAWRHRRAEKVRVLARPDGGSVAFSWRQAVVHPGTQGGVRVEYRVGERQPDGFPLLSRSGETPWVVVAIFPTEGRCAHALNSLVLPPPSFRFSWRAAAASAAVVAAVLILTPAPPLPVSSAQAGGAAARQLNLPSGEMPQPNISVPPLANLDAKPDLEVSLEEFMSCGP